MLFALLASSLATVFLVRIIPLILWGSPDWSTGDVMNHLNLIDGIRENRHRLPDFTKKFLLTDQEDYPVLFHWLLSFLPQRIVDRFEPVFGPAVETIHGGLVFLATYGFARWSWHSAQPEMVAVLATLMFAATPLLLGIENHGRVFRLSARPAGTLLTALSLLTVVLFRQSGNYAWLIAGGLVAGWVGLASQFGTQALTILIGLICLLSGDARPALILVFGLASGTAISRGHLFRVLRGHLRHSYFYCTYLTPKHPATTSYTLTNLILWPLTLFQNPRKAAELLLTHYVIISFTLFPWAVLLVATYIVHPKWIHSNGGVEMHLALWYLAGLMAMFATATRWLRFLGEASRYVIHAATPVCILSAYRLLSLNDTRLWTLAGILAVPALAGLLCNYWVSSAVRHADGERKRLYEWMKQQPPSTLLTIDLRLSFLLCFRTPHRAVNVHINAPKGRKLESYKRLIGESYPCPSSDLGELVREYQVDLLVVDVRATKVFEERSGGKTYDLSPFRLIYDTGRFRVYRAEEDATVGTEISPIRAAA